MYLVALRNSFIFCFEDNVFIIKLWPDCNKINFITL